MQGVVANGTVPQQQQQQAAAMAAVAAAAAAAAAAASAPGAMPPSVAPSAAAPPFPAAPAAGSAGTSAPSGGTAGSGRKVSTSDIQLVQNLIERCMQMYMPLKEVVSGARSCHWGTVRWGSSAFGRSTVVQHRVTPCVATGNPRAPWWNSLAAGVHAADAGQD